MARFINWIKSWYRQKKRHYLFPFLTLFVGTVVGLLVTPVIGAICFALTIYLILVIFVPWEKIHFRRIKFVMYIVPVVVCLLLVAPLWSKIVLMFPDNSNKVTFVPDLKNESSVITFETGNMAWSYTVRELENSKNSLCDFDELSIPLQVYVDNGQLFIDTSLYTGAGLPPAQIKYNQFVVKPENWNIHFDLFAFEVVNENKEPVFQLVFDTANHAIIRGFFSSQESVFITSEFGYGLPEQIKEYKFDRIFKY